MLTKKFFSIALLLLGVISVQAQNLNHLSSYKTGTADAAEVVTYDKTTQRAFFTSSSANSFSILDISDVTSPKLIKEISLADYGGGVNSIATANGIVAVAMETASKVGAGTIVLFDTDGKFLNQIKGGVLPDMLTFTPDGKKVIVADEGEPNDDYSIDPQGTVSIIDLSNGVDNATIKILDFKAYDDKKASLMNKGIRIFGNNGTAPVSRDLEPEYVTVTADGKIAYVNCQENNALAVIDLEEEKILDLLPLGYKNHKLGTPKITSYILNELVPNWPALGTPVYDGGQAPVMLGGFSGMWYDQNSSTDTEYVFYAVPDRGPNANTVSKSVAIPNASQNLRPFKLPNYQSRIVKFTLNKTTGDVTLNDQIMLVRQDGETPISGKGNIPGVDEVPVTYTDATTDYKNADYKDDQNEEYHQLPYDELGGDFEGVLIDKNNTFWLCDEYRPAIYQFKMDGTLIERYVAEGTSKLGTTEMPEGTYGKETLPAVYAKRWANRGFEAIAYDKDKHIIYAFIQSPMYNPSSATKNKSDIIRILGINAENGTPVSEYVYVLERNRESGYSGSRVDKIGDAVYTGNGKFLVIERDSEGPDNEMGQKYIFEIDINFATNILGTDLSKSTGEGEAKTLEEMTADELMANDIRFVHKYKVTNLPSIGYKSSDKAEGICMLPNNQIAVINDNDFGLAGAGITDNSVLGIISFANDYGFDASNKDDAINITNHPTLGMFMPDGIATYMANDKTYIVTANEGDSRDYEGYSEEVRVKDLELNPDYYANATELQKDSDLGRLKTTTANGDYNGDGKYEQIYSYGARSFSIFDQYGNLVYDSANAFAMAVAENETDLFNEDEAEKDGRSDDKGVEPEAVEIGTIDGKTYAFIGFERQSAIVAYDITDPKSPTLVHYYNNRTVEGETITGDVAPEIIKFVSATDSPNGENLLIVGYEVSGTVGIIQIGGTLSIASHDEIGNPNFKVYPNPVRTNLHFSETATGAVFSLTGQQVQQFEGETSINVEALTDDIYILKTDQGTRRFLKL